MTSSPAPTASFRRGLSAVGSSLAHAGSIVQHSLTSAADATKEKVSDFSWRFSSRIDKLNKWAATARVGRVFQLKERRTFLTGEMRAGTITFLMVAYILAVNPQILGTTGGDCNPQELCTTETYDELGPQCMFDDDNPQAQQCLETLKLNLITATAASSCISCFVIGYFANLPLALAPGMGINAYVAYQVVGPLGTGSLTYSQVMAAIFVEGWIFILLSLTGIRGGVIKYMPQNVSFAASVGIGLLLAFTGLRNLGVVVFDPYTLVALGGCTDGSREHVYVTTTQPLPTPTVNSSIFTEGGAYSCSGGEMRSATMWLGISGGVITAILLTRRVRGALFIGIAYVTIISWIPGHAASYLGAGSSIPGGEVRLDTFKQVVAAPSLSQTGLSWDWSAFNTSHLWLALFTFLYIDLLDCTGTLISMATLLDDVMREDALFEDGVEPAKPFLSESKEFHGQMWAFLADGIGIITGAMMGVTPLTVYIESAAGIEDGGRTGITAIVVSFFFFVSLFFSPILASIPPYATGPALVLVGVYLIAHVDRILWDEPRESIPAFLTIIIMPFTLSVAYGIIAGLASYAILNLPVYMYNHAANRVHQWKMKRALEAAMDVNGNIDQQPPPPPSTADSAGTAARRRRRQMAAMPRKAFGSTGSELVRTESYAGSDDGMSVRSYRSFESMALERMEGAMMMVPPGMRPATSPVSARPRSLVRSYSHAGITGGSGSADRDGILAASLAGKSLAEYRGSLPYPQNMASTGSHHGSRNPAAGGTNGPRRPYTGTTGGGGNTRSTSTGNLNRTSAVSVGSDLGLKRLSAMSLAKDHHPRGGSQQQQFRAGQSPAQRQLYASPPGTALQRASQSQALPQQQRAQKQQGERKMMRSQTFSSFGSGRSVEREATLGGLGGFKLFGDVASMKQQPAVDSRPSTSATAGGGGLFGGDGGFKLFGDTPPVDLSPKQSGDLESRPSGSAGGDGFKLFGDVSLPAAAKEEEQGGLGSDDGGGFKLFGDVAPMPLSQQQTTAASLNNPREQPDSESSSSGFKLFGDVPSMKFGAAEEPPTPSLARLSGSPSKQKKTIDTSNITSGGNEADESAGFRLFGDLPPMPLAPVASTTSTNTKNASGGTIGGKSIDLKAPGSTASTSTPSPFIAGTTSAAVAIPFARTDSGAAARSNSLSLPQGGLSIALSSDHHSDAETIPPNGNSAAGKEYTLSQSLHDDDNPPLAAVGSVEPPSRGQSGGLKRVESQAALRLKSLFTSSELDGESPP